MFDALGHPINDSNTQALNVLIVDDDPLAWGVISMMVASTGNSFNVARDGKEAVDLYRRLPGSFGLVIMDVEMPILDGIESTLLIREIDPYAKVILVSGNTKKDVWKAKPNAFVLKAFMHLELRGLITKYGKHAVPHQSDGR